MTSSPRPPRALIALAILVSVVTSLPAGPVAAAGATTQPAVMRIEGSPFDPNGDGRRERVTIKLELAGPSTVELRIDDFDGRRLRTLTGPEKLGPGEHTWAWDGRDARGRRVPYGPYKVRARVVTTDGTALWRSRWVTRSSRLPYPVAPGSILVALDPGHGGPADGAAWRGLVEDKVNLDIGLRLEAMLKGAGIGVVMTRRTDSNVSPVGRDLTGDGRYTRTDELIARNDIANWARADIHIAIHNNGSGCHCTRGTEMYTHFRRGWTPEGRKLASLVLREHMRHLKRLPRYRPHARGVLSHPFKALRPYHRRLMPRPSLQPSILGESLFVDWPSEHRILGRRSGRTTIAAAYFDGIARYLAWRPYGLRYEVLGVPSSAAAGSDIAVKLRLTNRGNRTSSSWQVVARVVKSVFRYDGRPRRGTVIARVAVPDGLAPGASVEVTLAGITLPPKRGTWLVKLDVDLPNGDHLADHGVVGPQLRVRTVVS